MGRNRVVGSPYQVETVTEDFTTGHAVDEYLVDAASVVCTLDPYAVNGDQVLIQDVTDGAATSPIVINASEGQVILNGFGESISIATNGGAVLLVMTTLGWVPLFSSGGSASAAKTFIRISPGQTYQVKPTDTVVQMWTDAARGASTAVLPADPAPDDTVTLAWTGWDGGQVPPVINGNGNNMTPYGGQTSPALTGGFVATTAITKTGGFMTLKYDGFSSVWIAVSMF
jgi:hypothetical protein